MSIVTGRRLNKYHEKAKAANKQLFADKSIYGDNAISVGRKAGTTVGSKSSAEGYKTTASGSYSHSEGCEATASGSYSHSEGNLTTASGAGSHAEGNSTTASKDYSHAEGFEATASGTHSHAEGYRTTASGSCSHSEGIITTASGDYSHAEGHETTASGNYSHAEGCNTTASNAYSHATGKYNKTMKTGTRLDNQVGDVFVIGNGYAVNFDSVLSNALRVTCQGEIYGTQSFKSSGADYAEHIKEWADGNPDNEDRVGYMVTIKNGFLHKANEGDYIAGITSGNPSVVGNADEDYYWKYERDAFNRIVMEDVPERVQKTERKLITQVVPQLDKKGNQIKDEDGNPLFEEIPRLDENGNEQYEDVPVYDEETHEPVMLETGNIIKNARMKLAEGYDSNLQDSYVERKDRKEWDYVGMVGVIPVRDDGTCLPGHFCKCGQGGVATLAEERGFDTFYVIERVAENIVSVELR